jgi:RimJ/RimL family protein N-acetyltransferase
MNIKGQKVTLRAIEEDDLPTLHRWSNDPQTQDIMGDIHFPSSMAFHKEWFHKLAHDKLNLRFAIDTPDLGIIGISSIIDINWRNNRAWHGVMLGDADIRGKGYGLDAVMATMRYAFDELHFVRLDGSMIEYNAASIKFYCGKLGWKEEGRRRNWFYRRGRYWDQVVVGVTDGDYRDLVSTNNYWGNTIE